LLIIHMGTFVPNMIQISKMAHMSLVKGLLIRHALTQKGDYDVK